MITIRKIGRYRVLSYGRRLYEAFDNFESSFWAVSDHTLSKRMAEMSDQRDYDGMDG